jgi:hypothetical protein
MNEHTIEIPDYAGAILPDGLELKGQTVFLSPPGCCAQTALPFWAKVVGKVKNTTEREMLIDIAVQLMDAGDKAINTYFDIMALEAGRTGEFDVKLVEYNKNMKKYFIALKEIEEDKL